MSFSTGTLRKPFTFSALFVVTLSIAASLGVLIAPPRAGADKPRDNAGIEPFIKMRWPGSANLAPDGTLYFIYNPDGINQLYKVAPGKTQKDAVKLTAFPDGIGGYDLSDDGRWITITAAIGGSEQFSLYLLDSASGKIDPLFTDPKVVYAGPVWRRDSKAFAYRANDESSADFHVYLYDLESRTHKKAYAGKGHHDAVDFNRDGTKLVVSKFNSASFSQLFEVDLAAGESREITPKGEEWSFEPVGYSADDRQFLVNTNYKSDLLAIHTIDLRSGEIKPVLSDLSGKEVDFGVLNEDRAVLAVGVNEDGYRTLHLRRAGDFTSVAGPQLSGGLVGNIAFRGKYMLYSLDNANTPGLIYKWDLNKPGEKGVVLTEADTQGIDVSKFRLPELVHYESFDGKKIPAFVYLPADYQKGKKIPFIVQYHGGPEGQYRPSFNRSFQYFVSRGYGVIAPNVRGSSGYGKEYIEADNYKNRDKSVKDGIWAAKYVVDQGYSDKRMLAAWGGSYGGFMVMAVITEAPELFGAACNIVGVVNFETFLEQTKDYRRALREVEYGPLTDREFLKSISPIYKVERITTPLMIAHGLNDPRVPVGEAMQIAVALKKRGMEVAELYFPDEGHGFAKEDNRLLYYKEMAKFFDKHLILQR
ncbi:MAG: S9 family peptidase [Phycisphaerales bacterium]|nr:S9 family peptidase [Phycisphaerales bacterium]